MYKKKGKNPLLVACDVYRPAAIDQLHVVGDSLNIPVFSMGNKISPVEIAKAGVEHAVRHGHDLVFIDTAGRLHIDEELMEELRRIKESVKPTEILLTVDAMTGQDAVNVAETFNELLDITGVVLTKMDGDTRGGAALFKIASMKSSGRPLQSAQVLLAKGHAVGAEQVVQVGAEAVGGAAHVDGVLGLQLT